MKKTRTIPLLIFCMIIHFSAKSTEIFCTPGKLDSLLSNEEKQSIKNLKILGEMDARDFRTIRSSLDSIEVLDLFDVEIVSYSGTEGTNSNEKGTFKPETNYLANTIPIRTFLPPYTSGYAKTPLQTIVLPKNCQTIDNTAFTGCEKLSYVGLPETLDSIKNSAFQGCPNLDNISLPKRLSYIGEGAFKRCSALKSIFIPENITVLPESIFYDCESLTSVELPYGLKKIETNAFCKCTALTKFMIPASVESLGNRVFDYSGVNKIYSFSRKPLNFFDAYVGSDVYDNEDILIYVPKGTTDSYGRASGFSYDFIGIDFDHPFSAETVRFEDSGEEMRSITVSYDKIKSVQTSADWLNVEAQTSSIYISAESNLGDAREGLIIVELAYNDIDTVTVIQDAFIPAVIIEETSISLPIDNENSSQILVDANVSWTAEVSENWLIIDYSDQSKLIVKAIKEKLPYESRSATITISGTGVEPQTLSVVQGPDKPYYCSPEYYSYTLKYTSKQTVHVTSEIPWTVSSNNDWISIISDTAFNGDASFSIEVSKNFSTERRNGTVTVKPATGLDFDILISQYDHRINLLAPEEGIQFKTHKDETQQITFESLYYSWKIVSNTDWIQFSDTTGGEGTFTIDITASENLSSERRSGELIILTKYDDMDTIRVVQPAKSKEVEQKEDTIEITDKNEQSTKLANQEKTHTAYLSVNNEIIVINTEGNTHVNIFSANGSLHSTLEVTEKEILSTDQFIPGLYLVQFSGTNIETQTFVIE